MTIYTALFIFWWTPRARTLGAVSATQEMLPRAYSLSKRPQTRVEATGAMWKEPISFDNCSIKGSVEGEIPFSFRVVPPMVYLVWERLS